jgi:cytochrome oxidase Cu insertion factor (SCO1/SenC/PrrC family)
MDVDFTGWTWVTGESTQLEKVWQAFGVVAYVDLATLNTGTTATAHGTPNASD